MPLVTVMDAVRSFHVGKGGRHWRRVWLLRLLTSQGINGRPCAHLFMGRLHITWLWPQVFRRKTLRSRDFLFVLKSI